MATYARLRYWWLHELRRLRASVRINGANVKADKERRAAQRKLVDLRRARVDMHANVS